MKDENLRTFVNVVRRYYPEKEIGAENNHVWANGYLGALVRCLLQKGYEEKTSFCGHGVCVCLFKFVNQLTI